MQTHLVLLGILVVIKSVNLCGNPAFTILYHRCFRGEESQNWLSCLLFLETSAFALPFHPNTEEFPSYSIKPFSWKLKTSVGFCLILIKIAKFIILLLEKVNVSHSYCHMGWPFSIFLTARASATNCLSAVVCLTRALSVGISLWGMSCFIQEVYQLNLRNKIRNLVLDTLNSVLSATMLSAGLNKKCLECSTDGRCEVDKLLLSDDFSVNECALLWRGKVLYHR